MKKIAMAAAAACLLGPATLWAQDPAGSWRLVPQLGVAFHGGYYDDVVVTRFADGDVDTDLLLIDPGAAFRVGLSAEYAATPLVWLSGGFAGSWPEANVRVDAVPRPDINLKVWEVSAGALIRLGEWGGGAKVFPFYVGGDLNFVWHRFDDLLWEGELTDVSTTSVGFSGRFGVEYSIGPKVDLRGEARAQLVRGGFGGLENELGSAAARDQGIAAETDLEGNTYSMFLLNAGLLVRL